MPTHSADKNPTHLWVKDITENNNISSCYLVKGKKTGTTRKGDPFLSLVLADRTGEVEARIWEGADEISPLFFEGDIVQVEGHSSLKFFRAEDAILDKNIDGNET